MPHYCAMDTKQIDRARTLSGGTVALARKVGVRPATVSEWVSGRRPVPAERCLSIERATNGSVTRYDLRPDVFGEAPQSEEAA